jgi:hypothetical protein
MGRTPSERKNEADKPPVRQGSVWSDMSSDIPEFEFLAEPHHSSNSSFGSESESEESRVEAPPCRIRSLDLEALERGGGEEESKEEELRPSESDFGPGFSIGDVEDMFPRMTNKQSSGSGKR